MKKNRHLIKKKKETGKEKPKKKKETGKEKPASDKKKKENGKGRSKKKKKETDKNKPEETKEDNLKKKEDKTENGKDKLTPYEGIDNPDFLAFLESEKAIEKPSSGLSSTSDDIFFLLGATSLEKPGPELNLIMNEIEKEIKKD